MYASQGGPRLFLVRYQRMRSTYEVMLEETIALPFALVTGMCVVRRTRVADGSPDPLLFYTVYVSQSECE